MGLQIDRDLPVPVAVQVQGLIEYGVSNGEFPPGSRLPSIRELSRELGVSPVTLSQAYRALQAKGIIETRPGHGTYVKSLTPAASAVISSRVDELIGLTIREGLREGMGRAELLERFQHLLAREHGANTPLQGVFVGIFLEVTRAYVADLERHLRPCDRLTATTFDALRSGSGAAVAGADFILTFAHRLNDLSGLSPELPDVAAIQVIPSERTRLALAELDPLARVVLVSRVPEFLPTFQQGVRRFASHIADVRAVLWDTPEARLAVAQADVVVYGTGSEAVLDGLSGRVRSFEYRHVPDPVYAERSLVPFLDRVRAKKFQSHGMPEEVV